MFLDYSYAKATLMNKANIHLGRRVGLGCWCKYDKEADLFIVSNVSKYVYNTQEKRYVAQTDKADYEQTPIAYLKKDGSIRINTSINTVLLRNLWGVTSYKSRSAKLEGRICHFNNVPYPVGSKPIWVTLQDGRIIPETPIPERKVNKEERNKIQKQIREALFHVNVRAKMGIYDDIVTYVSQRHYHVWRERLYAAMVDTETKKGAAELYECILQINAGDPEAMRKLIGMACMWRHFRCYKILDSSQLVDVLKRFMAARRASIYKSLGVYS